MQTLILPSFFGELVQTNFFSKKKKKDLDTPFLVLNDLLNKS